MNFDKLLGRLLLVVLIALVALAAGAMVVVAYVHLTL